MARLMKLLAWCASRPRWAMLMLAVFVICVRGSLYGLLHHYLNPSSLDPLVGARFGDIPVHLIHLQAEKRPKSARHFSYEDLFTLEPRLKDAENSFFVAIITSPENYENREMIRNTWAKLQLNKTQTHGFTVQRIFVMENIEDVEKYEKEAIHAEDAKYQDVLVVDGVFKSPLAETFKEVYALHYIARRAGSNLQYLLKTDDQTFINLERLLDIAWTHLAGEGHTTPDLMCYYLDEKKTLPADTFQEHLSQFEPDLYHRHCTGPVYIASGNILPRLLVTSLHETLIQNANAMLTGESIQESGDVIIFDFDIKEILFYNITGSETMVPEMDRGQIYSLGLPLHYWIGVQHQLRASIGTHMHNGKHNGDSKKRSRNGRSKMS